MYLVAGAKWNSFQHISGHSFPMVNTLILNATKEHLWHGKDHHNWALHCKTIGGGKGCIWFWFCSCSCLPLSNITQCYTMLCDVARHTTSDLPLLLTHFLFVLYWHTTWPSYIYLLILVLFSTSAILYISPHLQVDSYSSSSDALLDVSCLVYLLHNKLNPSDLLLVPCPAWPQ